MTALWCKRYSVSYCYELEVTIARKVLAPSQGIKGSMHNLLFMIPLCQEETECNLTLARGK